MDQPSFTCQLELLSIIKNSKKQEIDREKSYQVGIADFNLSDMYHNEQVMEP